MILTVPFVALAAVTLNVSPSMSVSLAITLMLFRGVSSVVTPISSVASGGSLTGLTVIVKVAVSLKPPSSETV